MTLLLCGSEQSAQLLRLSIGEEAIRAKNWAELHKILGSSAPEILVLIGPDEDLDLALKNVAEYRFSRPEIGFVLVRNSVGVGTLARAMQHGVREVVLAAKATDIFAASERSRAVSRRMTDGMAGEGSLSGGAITGRTDGQVVIVFSAKGGCGKTTVATNMAAELAQNYAGTVALIDLDLQFGDVAVSLGLEPNVTFSQALEMRESLDEAGVLGLLTEHSSKLKALLAPVDPQHIEQVTGELVGTVISRLRSNFDFVIIDSAPAFNEPILTAFELATSQVLLTTPDLASVKNLKVAVDTLDELGFAAVSRTVVVNRVPVGRQNTQINAAITEIAASSNLVEIPESQLITESINAGIPLVNFTDDDPAAQAFKNLVAQLTGAKTLTAERPKRWQTLRRLVGK